MRLDAVFSAINGMTLKASSERRDGGDGTLLAWPDVDQLVLRPLCWARPAVSQASIQPAILPAHYWQQPTIQSSVQDYSSVASYLHHIAQPLKSLSVLLGPWPAPRSLQPPASYGRPLSITPSITRLLKSAQIAAPTRTLVKHTRRTQPCEAPRKDGVT